MPISLPPIIEAYFRASNAHDVLAQAACFAENAVAHDENQEFRGLAEIGNWLEDTQKYQTTSTVTDVTQQNSKTVVTAQVSGNFDGSPIELQFHFSLEDDKIAALTIQ